MHTLIILSPDDLDGIQSVLNTVTVCVPTESDASLWMSTGTAISWLIKLWGYEAVTAAQIVKRRY